MKYEVYEAPAVEIIDIGAEIVRTENIIGASNNYAGQYNEVTKSVGEFDIGI